jgi:hypothetical protein
MTAIEKPHVWEVEHWDGSEEGLAQLSKEGFQNALEDYLGQEIYILRRKDWKGNLRIRIYTWEQFHREFNQHD